MEQRDLGEMAYKGSPTKESNYESHQNNVKMSQEPTWSSTPTYPLADGETM